MLVNKNKDNEILGATVIVIKRKIYHVDYIIQLKAKGTHTHTLTETSGLCVFLCASVVRHTGGATRWS